MLNALEAISFTIQLQDPFSRWEMQISCGSWVWEGKEHKECCLWGRTCYWYWSSPHTYCCSRHNSSNRKIMFKQLLMILFQNKTIMRFSLNMKLHFTPVLQQVYWHWSNFTSPSLPLNFNTSIWLLIQLIFNQSNYSLNCSITFC